MAPTKHEHGLRKLLIATFIPAFTLTIAAGAMSESATPYWYHTPTVVYFGLLPLFFTLFSSILFLRADAKHTDPTSKRKLRTALSLVLDFILFLGYFSVLIPIWIVEPPKLNGHANYMMLQTYATCFFLLNAFIHAYIFLVQTIDVVGFISSIFGPRECPHCHERLDACAGTPKDGMRTTGGYSLLRTDSFHDEPEASDAVIRPSIEEV